MLLDEPKIFFLERRYFFSIILSEFLKNRVALHLLVHFLDMTDQEIADKLDMMRRTVQYKRAQSLKELKKEMEVTKDGAQSE